VTAHRRRSATPIAMVPMLAPADLGVSNKTVSKARNAGVTDVRGAVAFVLNTRRHRRRARGAGKAGAAVSLTP
jgi:hypothetical protein